MKALPIEVYKDRGRDWSNDGITSKYDQLLLICEEGYIEVDEANPPENLVKIVTRRFGDREYKHIEPYAPLNFNCIGWMAGGCIGYSCDSRFSEMSEYPLSIHDRQETQELYNMLSH